MAGNEGKAALGKSQLATGRTRNKPHRKSKTRTPKKSKTSRNTKPAREHRPTLPFSFVTRDGETTIRHFEGRRVIRMGEVQGKRVARLEVFTAREAHYLAVRFQDQTVLSIEITPIFTLKPELYRLTTGDPETIRKWAEIRSER